jgi:tRNA nucleotidyltransferase (CCA-adding enzyme)
MLALDRPENRDDLFSLMSVLLHDIGKKDVSFKDERGIIHFYGHEEASAKKAEEILRRMKFQSDFIKRVVWVVRNHMRAMHFEKMADFKLYSLMSKEYSDTLKKMVLSDLFGSRPDAMSCFNGRLDAVIEKYKDKRVLVSNDDLVAEGLPSDRLFGRITEKVMELQFNGKLKTREEVIKFAKGMHHSIIAQEEMNKRKRLGRNKQKE